MSGLRTHTFILAVTFALASACTPGPTTQATPPAGSGSKDNSHSVTVPRDQADNVTAHGEISCASLPGGSCPPALAMSVARVDKSDVSKLYQCTAFLVGPDLIATNTHCLPEDIRSKGASCAYRMTFYFGNSGQEQSEIAACDKVVSVTTIATRDQTEDFNLHPDLAFLKLQRPLSRKPLKLSRWGVVNNYALSVYSIDPANSEHQLHGVARLRTCVAKQNSLVTPQYTNDFADVISAACLAVAGNSGSPALDTDGNVRAVLHARRPVALIKTETYKGFRMPNHFDEMVFLTNMTCADAPKSLKLGPVSNVCGAPVPTRQNLVRSLKRLRNIDVDYPFSAWLPYSPKSFEFEIDYLSSNSGRVSLPRVKCINSPELWISKPAADIRVQTVQISESKIAVAMALPAWGPQPTLDSTERVRIETGEIDRAQMTVSFDPRFLIKNGFARVTETFDSDLGLLSGASSSTFDLPVCK
jgi:hypothetical protein